MLLLEGGEDSAPHVGPGLEFTRAPSTSHEGLPPPASIWQRAQDTSSRGLGDGGELPQHVLHRLSTSTKAQQQLEQQSPQKPRPAFGIPTGSAALRPPVHMPTIEIKLWRADLITSVVETDSMGKVAFPPDSLEPFSWLYGGGEWGWGTGGTAWSPSTGKVP